MASHDPSAVPDCHHGQVRPSVLVVDDHADFREAARALLEADGFDVVGVAGSGEEACALVARLRPGLVLLDLRLPGEDGFAVAERLAAFSDARGGGI